MLLRELNVYTSWPTTIMFAPAMVGTSTAPLPPPGSLATAVAVAASNPEPPEIMVAAVMTPDAMVSVAVAPVPPEALENVTPVRAL